MVCSFPLCSPLQVACDVEDGSMLYWLPAVVVRHALGEDLAVIGYGVRMLDSDDTFTSKGDEADAVVVRGGFTCMGRDKHVALHVSRTEPRTAPPWPCCEDEAPENPSHSWYRFPWRT